MITAGTIKREGGDKTQAPAEGLNFDRNNDKSLTRSGGKTDAGR